MSEMSKKMKKSSPASDRITTLPDSILHHILSFLDMKMVVQTSLLSTRWRYLWKSIPCLNFIDLEWSTKKAKNKINLQNQKVKFMNFIDRVLSMHDESIINKFCLFAVSNGCDANHIDAWITALSRRRVNEVYLKISRNELRVFPSILFTSRIVVFEMVYYTQLPDSLFSASHLRTLKLKGAILPKGNSIGELVFRCPVLENLTIDGCDHGEVQVLSICATLLKILSISHGWISSLFSCQIKLCTPNLESLNLRGYLYADYELENFSKLASAKIHLDRHYLSNPNHNVCTQLMIKVLKSLTNATVLELSWPMLKSTSDLSCQDMIDETFSLFCNLQSLKLTKGFGISCINAVVNLLKSSPNIESVFWHLYYQENDTPMIRNDLEEMLTFKCLFRHLKSVKLQFLKGNEVELKFLEFLLKNALVLEDLAILLSVKGDKLKDFIKKLQSFARASASRPVILLQN